MVVLVELFAAAGLLVGAALQPTASSSAPSASKGKMGFMFFDRRNLCHAIARSSNFPPAPAIEAKLISSAFEIH